MFIMVVISLTGRSVGVFMTELSRYFASMVEGKGWEMFGIQSLSETRLPVMCLQNVCL